MGANSSTEGRKEGRSTGFLGFPRKLCMKGPGCDGREFHLQSMASGKHPCYMRSHDGSTIAFDEVSKLWTQTEGGDVVRKSLFASILGPMPYPIGPWEKKCTVHASKESASLLSYLAFPAPDLDFNFYCTGGAGAVDIANGVVYPSLLSHPDLLVLKTNRNERIPALHVKRTGSFTKQCERLQKLLPYLNMCLCFCV
jgi:hypothetical protein